MNLTPNARLLDDVIALARRAGDRILEVYESDFAVTHKDDDSPLTQADLASHKAIVAGLERLTPGIPVLSEEGADTPYAVRRDWAQYWLVDPLDGTKEFIARNDEFTVNIALIDQQLLKPAVGFGDVQLDVDVRVGPVELRDHSLQPHLVLAVEHREGMMRDGKARNGERAKHEAGQQRGEVERGEADVPEHRLEHRAEPVQDVHVERDVQEAAVQEAAGVDADGGTPVPALDDRRFAGVGELRQAVEGGAERVRLGDAQGLPCGRSRGAGITRDAAANVLSTTVSPRAMRCTASTRALGLERLLR